jgi:hypothetical protein
MSVDILNDGPIFTVPSFPLVRIPINKNANLDFGDKIFDTEGHSIIMSFTELTNLGEFPIDPSYASQSGPHSIHFAPTLFSQMGIKNFIIYITDTLATSSQTFSIEIYNTPPYFVE